MSRQKKNEEKSRKVKEKQCLSSRGRSLPRQIQVDNTLRKWWEVLAPAIRWHLKLGDSARIGNLAVWSKGNTGFGIPSRIPRLEIIWKSMNTLKLWCSLYYSWCSPGPPDTHAYLSPGQPRQWASPVKGWAFKSNRPSHEVGVGMK